MSLTRHLQGIAAIIVGVGSGLGGGSAGTPPGSSGTAASPSAAVRPAGSSGPAISRGPAPNAVKRGPFEIGPASSQGGGVALEPSGTLVVVYDVNPTTVVCLIRVGGRRCGHVTHLRPPSHDSTFGTPQVFIPAPNRVGVLQMTCCDGATAGGDLLYSSSNGGRTFSAPVRVGTLAVFRATLIGRRIVFTAANDSAGAQVESIPVTATGPPASIATAFARTAYSAAVGQCQGGVLIGSDFIGTSTTTTHVEYAAKGKDFNASGSYRRVATFAGERLLAMSGAALLTVQVRHGNAALLRIFNGHSFGRAHVVPGASGGGPQWFTVNAGINRRGHGLVLGTDPAWAYPVP
jgi:hypothetical protein